MVDGRVGRVEGYAIISEDGMLADAHRIMPASLQIEADQRFFEEGLNGVDVVVHGRHSQEQQPRSRERNRVILTRRIPALSPHPTNPKALLWNPAGAPFEDTLKSFGISNARVGVIGGAEVFQLFLFQYDVFWLTRAPGVTLPGGRPVFPEVPELKPEDILSAHGLMPGPVKMLDAARDLTVVGWTPAAA
jgi:dihydrofolate reductase